MSSFFLIFSLLIFPYSPEMKKEKKKKKERAFRTWLRIIPII